MKHLNYKSCPRCDEFLKSTDVRLQKWFKAQKEKDPSLHISCSTRGALAQAEAKKSGASEADYGKSPHNYSPALALDLFWITDGNGVWSKTKYAELSKTLDKELEWGGTFKNFDGPHFQVRGWKSFAKNYPKGSV